MLSALRHRAAELGAQAEFRQVERYTPRCGVRRPAGLAGVRADVVRRPRVRRLVAGGGPAGAGLRDGGGGVAAWAAGRGRRLCCCWRTSTARRGSAMTSSWTAPSRAAGDGISTRTTGSRRRRVPTASAYRSRGGRPRTRSTRRYGGTWTAGRRPGDVSFVGRDAPRWAAATRSEALHVLRDFVEHRLPAFGPHEDAMLADDPWLAHSLLSVPLSLGLLDPLEVVPGWRRPTAPAVPLASAEGFAGRSSAGGTTSGTSTGTSVRRTARPTPWPRGGRCRGGSRPWTPMPSRRGASPTSWPASPTAGGCTTSCG